MATVLFCVTNFFSYQAMSDNMESAIEQLREKYDKEVGKYSDAMLEMQTQRIPPLDPV
jgi:elongation factor P hydroxylase